MKQKMQWLFTTLLLLLATALNAQFTITATTTPEFCAGTGTATFNINNAIPGSTFDFVITQLPGSTPYRTVSDIPVTTANFSHTETLLPAGNYTVKAIQNNAGVLTERNASFTITSNFKQVSFTLSSSQVCAGANIKVNVSSIGGVAAGYELRNTSNTVLVPWQSSDTFLVTANGTYRVAVKDACGNVTVKDINVTMNTNKFTFLAGASQEITSCNTYTASYGLNSNGAENYRYPVNITVRIENTTTGLDDTIMWVANNYSELIKPVTGLPMTGTNKVTISYVDACGYTNSSVSNTTPKPSFNFNTSNSSCGGKYLTINNFQWYYKDAPVTVKFIQYPASFNPVNYNSDFAGDGDGNDYSHTYTSLPNAVQFGGGTQGLPNGNYKVETTSCGITTTHTYNVNISTASLIMSSATYATSCDTSKGFVTVRPNNNIDELETITVTAAPIAFVAEFGALPYDLSSYIGNAANYQSQSSTIIELPVGNYTFTYKDTCGRLATQNVTIIGRTFTANPVTHQRFCGGGFTVTSTLSGYNGNVYVYLQKKYTGGWGNPTNSNNIGFPTNNNPATAVRVGNGYGGGTSEVINTTGEFRVVAVWQDSQTGVSCPNFELLDTFTIDAATLKMNDYYVVACANNTYNLMIDASGIGALTYKIVEKDGQPFIIDNGTDPVFTNLAEGSYKVEITDSQCLDVITVTVRVITTKMPIIRASNLCEGENGKLYVSGASYLTVEWYKNGVSTGVFGHSFPFTPYTSATDIGLYEAHLSYSPNPNTCINNVLSFNLTAGMENTPNAGTGQSVTIQQNTLTGPINLFDYLTPPYDAHGYWTDENNTGLLMGNNWYGQFSNGGTYEFKYIVDGTCTNSAEATVTIKLEGYCTQSGNFTDAGIPTKVGITVQQKQAAWPENIPNGFIALESKEKGMVITRVAKVGGGTDGTPAATDAIADPKEGMLVYDIEDKCVKLFNGTIWNCITRSCND